ncbi:MAG: hypothetical protein M1819_003996 [Sarea resinae]|nr:MAG: hypothetical protein M1819_003996 [Sarea resinae]
MMMTVKRSFGKFLPKTADEAQIIDGTKAWRDAWSNILTIQYNLANEFNAIYNPVVGTSESGALHEPHGPVPTPQENLARTSDLREAYEELRHELLAEVNMVDARILQPAITTRDSLQPFKKVIKKRQEKRLDYDRYSSRVDNLRKKTKRSDRENATLVKQENDLATATEQFHEATDHIKHTLPPLLAAAYSLLPHLLAAQVMTQNTLLAQYYTTLHSYCQDHNYPSPSPPMEQVVSEWSDAFKPVQHEVESGIETIAHGKAVQHPMELDPRQNSSSVSGFNIRGNISSSMNNRRRSSQHDSKPALSPELRPSTANPSSSPSGRPKIGSFTPSSASGMLSPPASSGMLSPSSNDYHTPSSETGHAPAGPHADYFARDRPQSSGALSTAAAGKKKPPPPPPKRLASNQGQWVVALYDFEGQGEGDLTFRERDRIKVVKKTASSDDWWEGELRGVRGSFPANYCQPA